MTLNITEYRGALTLTLALLQSERLPNSTRSLGKVRTTYDTFSQSGYYPESAIPTDNWLSSRKPLGSLESKARRHLITATVPCGGPAGADDSHHLFSLAAAAP